MKHGFVNAAAVTPELRVADIEYNTEKICEYIDKAVKGNCDIAVFPELCITGYTCHDLFLQDVLIDRALDALIRIAEYTENLRGIFFVGLPLIAGSKLYNVAAAVSGGKILALIPKTFLPNYNEFYEARHFCSGENISTEIIINGESVPFGTKTILCCSELPQLRIAAELCEDLWAPVPPGINHAVASATVLVNLSASNEITGKSMYRRELVKGQSARLICSYVYASAGSDESSQDLVFSGHNLIAENGTVLSESQLFSRGITSASIDVRYLDEERRRMNTYSNYTADDYRKIYFSLKNRETEIKRYIDPHPFVPADDSRRAQRCNEIIAIQAEGLKKRLKHIGCKTAVIGISGGLDSTLALLITVKAFDLLGLDHSGIIAVTMPGFGTTGRTYNNSVNLIKCINATFKEVSIIDAVGIHFRDIGQDPDVHDVTYENSQARERTQILMDIANKENGIVIGTGDLSELALGWATYNGDHMSMYAVNSSVPKTLVRYLVRNIADSDSSSLLRDTLYDILDTPVSPELLPPEEGKISQITEDLVGPYELHDFFLYRMLRCGNSPDKVFRMAKTAFNGVYDDETISKWLKTFYRRFFSQHFKRSCLPDGPKVGSVALSPRGDLRMPSDACAALWLKEAENI